MVKVNGETDLLKRPEACVVVANHQSSIDLLGMFVIWGRSIFNVHVTNQNYVRIWADWKEWQLLLSSPSCTTALLASLLFSVAPSSWTGPPAALINVMNDQCLSRSNPQQAALKLNSASETLKEENTKLWIFPEGTRYTVQWEEFEYGSFCKIVGLHFNFHCWGMGTKV